MKIPFSSGKCKLTSPFGMRTLNGVTKPHNGYDLVGVNSTTVTAVEGGKVVQSRMVTDKADKTWEWGNYVCVQTASGQYHYYCHLASRAVSRGMTVKAGDTLGVMGNTGSSQGAHLHFEVRNGSTPVSPTAVTGIPNAVGTYALTDLDRDLATLVEKKQIASPDYWRAKAGTVQYLAELIHKFAEAVR